MAQAEDVRDLPQKGWRADRLTIHLARSPRRRVKLQVAAVHATCLAVMLLAGALWPPVTLLLFVLWCVVALHSQWRWTHETTLFEAHFDPEERSLRVRGAKVRIPDDGVLLVETFRRTDRVFRRMGIRHEARLSWLPDRAALAQHRRTLERLPSRDGVPWIAHDQALPSPPTRSVELFVGLPSQGLRSLAVEMAFALRLPLFDLLEGRAKEIEPVAARDRLAMLAGGEVAPPPAKLPRRVETLESPGELRLRIGLRRRLAYTLLAISLGVSAALVAASWFIHGAGLLTTFFAICWNLGLALRLLDHRRVRITADGVQLGTSFLGLCPMLPPVRYADLTGVDVQRSRGKQCVLTLSGAREWRQLELRRDEAEYVRACVLHPPARTTGRAYR